MQEYGKFWGIVRPKLVEANRAAADMSCASEINRAKVCVCLVFTN
ncbi:hypothetical protein IMSAGC002_04104 [Lachnospiraceae bacterium]|nr:hypothetical protein IMSAGC002_04104 [Lachnospiraceae bacterium]